MVSPELPMGLDVYNSLSFGRLDHTGQVEFAECLWYDWEEEGDALPIVSSLQAAEGAATAFRQQCPDRPCLLTGVYLCYGYAQGEEQGNVLVRPIWVVTFNEGEASVTVDASDAQVLELRKRLE